MPCMNATVMIRAAARKQRCTIFQFLLQHGADPWAMDAMYPHGSLLHWAVLMGYCTDMYELDQLHGFANDDHLNNHEHNFDITVSDARGRTPPMTLLAVKPALGGLVERVQHLLTPGANPEHTDNEGVTSLHLAASTNPALVICPLLWQQDGRVRVTHNWIDRARRHG